MLEEQAKHRTTLGFAGRRAGGYGWGYCCTKLFSALSERIDVIDVFREDSKTETYPFPVFVPLVDHNLSPCSPVRGTRNFGYAFLERSVSQAAVESAQRHDVVFAGSSWCLARLEDAGIMNGQLLIQGVDPKVFYERAVKREDDEIRIFSGGKLEFRKGQDLVLAAFRVIAKRWPQARLWCNWFNRWPETIRSMHKSRVIEFTYQPEDQIELVHRLCQLNGISPEQVRVFPQLSTQEVADRMRETDFGVFPNRCEGGTNLVLMEYMSCGKAAVCSTGTGHSDILEEQNHVALTKGNYGSKWSEPDVDELIGAMENMVRDPSCRTSVGIKAGLSMRKWTWVRAADQIITNVRAT